MPYKFYLSLLLGPWIVLSSLSLNADATDIKIPSKIWEIFEAEDLNIKNSSFAFTDVQVTFKEKSSGVLKSQNQDGATKIELPKGGGLIDLANYINSDRGTFFVGIQFEHIDPIDDIKVFFVSNSRKRRLDGEVWGSGCKTFIDLTGFYKSKMQKTDLEVNTNRNRHLTLLGGSFVFKIKSGKQTYLSQVTFTDSNEGQFFCN